MGFRIEGLELRVQGSELGVWGFGFGIWSMPSMSPILDAMSIALCEEKYLCGTKRGKHAT